MAGLLGYAAAGALTGIGKGMLQDSLAQRDAVKEELRRQHDRQMRQEDQKFRSGERQAGQDFTAGQNALNRDQQMEMEGLRSKREDARLDRQESMRLRELEQQAGLAREDREFRSGEREAAASQYTDKIQGADGTYYGVNKLGEAKPLAGPDGEPIAGAPPKRKLDPDEMTASQKSAAIRNARRDAEVIDPEDIAGKNKIVDYERFADNIASSGAPITPEVRSEITRGLRGQIEKQVQTEAEGRAGAKGGFLSRAKPDDYGGKSRDQWVKDEVQERLDKRMVDLGMADKAVTAPAQGQGADAPAAQPATAYTRESPAAPKSEADFNALPSGAIYRNPSDGKLYRKN